LDRLPRHVGAGGIAAAGAPAARRLERAFRDPPRTGLDARCPRLAGARRVVVVLAEEPRAVRAVPRACGDRLAAAPAPAVPVVARLHAAVRDQQPERPGREDRKSTRLNSSHVAISYAVFCLKKKNTVPWS